MDCRFCQHYHFEGHRQGSCLLLGAPVEGSSPMCCLAIPPFAAEGELSLPLTQQSPELKPMGSVIDYHDRIERIACD